MTDMPQPHPEPPPGQGTPGTPGTPGSPGTPSSSSSSGSSAPAVDPVVAQKESLFRSIYISLWGEPPTEAYLKAAATGGLNAFEFEEHERHKPAFQKTETYAKEADSFLQSYGFLQHYRTKPMAKKKSGGHPGDHQGTNQGGNQNQGGAQHATNYFGPGGK